MIFKTSYDDLGEFDDFGQENIPPDLRSSDLPSKRLLGKGLASIGYETEWKGVKYARKDFVAVPSDIFRQEAGVLLKLPDHENVVKTHGLTVDKLSCSLVLDYMDDKLTDLLQKRKDMRERSPAGEHDLTLQESLGLILQIARAVEHLHKHGILHGDLKSRNILVTYMNDGGKSLLVKSVKVADFGLVQTKRNSMPYVSSPVRKLDMVRWKAPENLMELFREAKVSPDPKSSDSDEAFTGSACVTQSDDAYCFGLTCFQILTGEEPYPNRNWKELVIDIVSKKPGLKFPSNLSCPQGLRELVDVCCDADPDKRPSFFYIREKLEDMHSLQPKQMEARDLVREPIPQVSEALTIIGYVTEISSKFLINKHECERLAARFGAIGEKLKEVSVEFVGARAEPDSNKMEHPAFDLLLTVLKRGKALLSKYIESEASIPIRTEDREAFREIHAELDMLNSQFPFDNFQYPSESMLTGDADEGKQELPGNLGQTSTVAPANMEKMKVVVSEKIEGRATDDDLPSYLNIDPASVETEDLVRMPEEQRRARNLPGEAAELVVRRREIVRELGLDGGVNGLYYADYVILPEELVLHRNIGAGIMGEVYAVDWKGTPCTLKVIYGYVLYGYLPRCFKMLPTLIHENIVRFLGYSLSRSGMFEDEMCPSILMELIASDLQAYLVEVPRDLEWHIRRFLQRSCKIMKGIAEGMKYLHGKDWVHGNLTPAQVLVNRSDPGGDADDIVVKLNVSLDSLWSVPTRYAAPEVLQARHDRELRGRIDDKKADVYSFAITCSDILGGDEDYSFRTSPHHFKEGVIGGSLRPKLPEETSQDLQVLIKRCWHPDPAERPSFGDICDFFSQPMPVHNMSLPQRSPSPELSQFETPSLHKLM